MHTKGPDDLVLSYNEHDDNGRSFRRRNTDTFFSRPVFTHLITLVLAASGSWFAMKQLESTSAASQLASAYDRIAILEVKNEALIDRLIGLEAKLTLLKIAYKSENSPKVSVYKLLDAMGRPASIKKYNAEKDSFQMLYVNHAHELFYGMTNAFIAGKTSEEVYEVENAQELTEGDRRAYNSKMFIQVRHQLTLNKEKYEVRFWRFYLKFPDNTETIVGIQISETKLKDLQ